jgi:hypothetical protein
MAWWSSCDAGDSYFVELIEPELGQSGVRAMVAASRDTAAERGLPGVPPSASGAILAERMTFLVADNPEVQVVVFLPAAEANSISEMRKVIGAFYNRASHSCLLIALASHTSNLGRVNPTSSDITLNLYPYRRSA